MNFLEVFLVKYSLSGGCFFLACLDYSFYQFLNQLLLYVKDEIVTFYALYCFVKQNTIRYISMYQVAAAVVGHLAILSSISNLPAL